MARLAAAVAMCVAVTACSPPTPAEESVVDDLLPIARQADAELRALDRNVDQSYEDISDLYLRIVDARLPNIFAILADRAERIEAPPGGEPIHEEFVRFLRRVLSFAEDLDAAVAGDDLTSAAIAIVGIEATAADLALRLPPDACRALTGERWHHLCAPPAPFQGYEAALDVALRAFVAAYEPVTDPPMVFGKVVRGQVDGILQGEVVMLIDLTLGRLDRAGPPNPYLSLHAEIVDYFEAIRSHWTDVAVDHGVADPVLHEVLTGRLEGEFCSRLPAIQAEQQRVVAAVPDARIQEVTDIWFDAGRC